MTTSVQQMADRVAFLMEERLKIRGTGLPEKLARGGRFLPRRVRARAGYLAQAAAQAQSPKLQAQLDHERIADAYDVCVRYLKPLGVGARRRAALVHFAASLAGIVIVTAALVVTILVWRGYL